MHILVTALVTALLGYLAIGAACFAHPAGPALPGDFHWRRQLGIFRATLPDVLCWPARLWASGQGGR